MLISEIVCEIMLFYVLLLLYKSVALLVGNMFSFTHRVWVFSCTLCVGVLFYCIGPTKRFFECTEIAIEHDADPNNRGGEDDTPVIVFACETAKQNEDICLAILNAGAEPTLAEAVGISVCLLLL